MKKKICIIAEGYPTKLNPVYSFIDQIACAFADYGYEIVVIAPQSITRCIFGNKKLNPRKWVKLTGKNNSITVYQPYYFTFSNYGLSLKIQYFLFRLCVKYVVRTNSIESDIYYGHFWSCGLIAAEIANKANKKSFTVSGESIIDIFKFAKYSYVMQMSKKTNGVICVSTSNQTQNINLGLCNKQNSIVILNAIDTNKFYKYNQKKSRMKLGFPENIFIVIYVGSFTERKGINRLCSALSSLNKKNIYAIFIGSGPLNPNYERTLYVGSVPHDDIVYYLNASDIFVLPTLNEGCSNAILEAIACGLPIISSDLPFNKDILNTKNSILINPIDEFQIVNSISMLYHNIKIRKSISRECIKQSINISIDNRLNRINDFLNK